MDYRNPEFKDVMDNLLLDAKPSTEDFLTSQVANSPKSEFQAFAGNPTLPENLYEFIYDNDSQLPTGLACGLVKSQLGNCPVGRHSGD
ncbi:MAG: hypothetical protein WC942_01400 [Clostridia bacterium]|jgi:hypothetical protein